MDQPNPLFRMEAIEARQAQFMGTVRLQRPISFSVATSAAVLLGLALLLFGARGSIHRKATVSGLLVPAQGAATLSAPQAGIIVQRHVQEGDVVAQGQTLFDIDTPRQSSSGDTAARIADQLQARLLALDNEARLRQVQHTQRDQALRDRIRGTGAEIQRQREELLLQSSRVKLLLRTVERHRRLSAEGFVSESQAQQKEEEWLDAKSRVRSLERVQAGLTRDLLSLTAEQSQLQAQLQTDLGQISRQRASLEQERAENDGRRSALISAPTAGMVAALNLQVGQTVQTGQTLGTIVPADAQLEAHIYAPSQRAGFVEEGQPVFLRYAAYPYQKFGMQAGTVRQVSRTPLAAQDLPAGLTLEGQQSLYRITVQLNAQALKAYGKTHQLKPGMTLEADVLQESRAIWEWILEPVLATTARVKAYDQVPPVTPR